MLAEIGAAEDAGGRSPGAGGPALDPCEAIQLEWRGHTREELLPDLKAALKARLAGVRKDDIESDLLDLLKKGLGNAYKRGNREDTRKWITVKVSLATKGAVVAISDEGKGFDVQALVSRLLRDERYFENAGSGLSRFEKSRSLVSWEDGGRTLLICFRCRPDPGRPLAGSGGGSLGMAGDGDAMGRRFQGQVPYFAKNRLRIESCRAYVGGKEPREAPEVRYVVECRKTSGAGKSVGLLGRLLPRAAVTRDFRIARELYRGVFRERGGMRIPKPLAALREPSMVLYRFEPERTLRERVKRVTRLGGLAKAVRKVALALMTLHASELSAGPEEAPEAEIRRGRSLHAKVQARLVDTPWSGRVDGYADRLAARLAALGTWERVPIHGSFGWDSIVYDRNGEPYLFRFDQCRRSHPGLDLGGFLADLLRFHLAREQGSPEFYSAAQDAFLDAYFGQRAPPWRDDLPCFVTCALLQRLDRLLLRPRDKWEPKVDALLGELERTLS
jgi:anti-sigma regulatory factor (Ser/Thr protein kinase)